MEISIGATGSDGVQWGFRFGSGGASALAVGEYTGVVGFDAGSADHAALSVSRNVTVCGDVTGSFRIEELEFSGGHLRRFRATFVQHCYGVAPRAVGCVAFTAP